MTHPEIEELSAALDGEAREELRSHLSECPECQGLVRELEVMKSLAAERDSRPPVPDLWPGIARAVRRPSLGGRLGAWLREPSVAWAAALAMGVVAVLALSRQPDRGSTAAREETPGINRELEDARAAYLEAIERLTPAANAGQVRLPATVRDKLTASLELVDREIRDCERLLQDAPEDPMGQEALLALYDEKVRVLRASIEADELGGVE